MSLEIEVIEAPPTGGRPVSKRSTVTELLADRKDEIHAAIAEASTLASEARLDDSASDGFKVSELQVTFGITLKAEAGVFLAKAGTDASLQVSIKMSR